MMQDVCCSTTHLGKGTRCAFPLHPSGHWLFLGIRTHCRASRTYHRSITRRALEHCRSTLHPNHARNVWPFDHQSGELSSSHRYPHDHFMETTSSRAKGVPALVQSVTRKEAFHSSLALEPSLRPEGVSPPPDPRAGLGDMPLHLHRTMHKRLAV